jgi:hypothetical protein
LSHPIVLCSLRQWLTIALVLGVYSLPLGQGLAYITYLHLQLLLGLPTPFSVAYKPCKGGTLSAFATRDPTLPGWTAVSFDMDGIPFIVDNSATCIIASVQVTVNTIENSKTRQHYKGTIHLKLVDDANIKYTYDIPGAIYDPASNFNLLGISKLAKYFKDWNSLPGDGVDCNGTTIKSSGC